MDILKKKIIVSKKNLSLVPEDPGIYVFIAQSTPVYVGKAKNLKNRLTSYFLTNLGEKTAAMIRDSNYFTFIETVSEIEALLLETRLINSYKPKYNVAQKDDKNPLYIKVSSDAFPTITAVRKYDLKHSTKYSFGPFPSSYIVKNVLAQIRKVYPFANHKVGKKTCIYSQMGLCNPCPSYIASLKDPKEVAILIKEYKNNIRNVLRILRGHSKKLLAELEKDMTKYAKQKNYEQAQVAKEKINKLLYIGQGRNDPGSYLENPNLSQDIHLQELQALSGILEKFGPIQNLTRIECYDIAHLAGSFPTASMTVFVNGVATPSLYRHFTIPEKLGGDDYASLANVAQRRTGHFADWGKPDLIVVDGGKGQLTTFLDVFAKYKIPVVGLAKRNEKLLVFNPKKLAGVGGFEEIQLVPPALFLLQRIRDEAHRFSRRLHHKQLSKKLLQIV